MSPGYDATVVKCISPAYKAIVVKFISSATCVTTCGTLLQSIPFELLRDCSALDKQGSTANVGIKCLSTLEFHHMGSCLDYSMVGICYNNAETIN